MAAGVGAAIAYPTAKAMKQAGNHVISILGARNKELVILETEIGAISDELLITTDDGSYGQKGLVTDQLKALIDSGRKIDFVLAIGPVRMMQAVAETTRPHAHQDGRQPELDDGRRHRHVRRLPRAHHHRARSSPASTAPNSTPTRSITTCSSSRNRMYLKQKPRRSSGSWQHPEHDLDLVHESCRLEQKHPEVRLLRPTIMSANPPGHAAFPTRNGSRSRGSTCPSRTPDRRRTNFEEVNQGLTVLGATTEALRCLQCTSPKCMAGCPVGVKVKDFVQLIVAGDYLGAAAKIREDNILPAITGRVCPQETQCEGCCILGNKFEPLGIGYLERFVADYEREYRPDRASREGRRRRARKSPSSAAARPA